MVKHKEQFKILTPREHVRTRANMYVGSTSLETVDMFSIGQYKSVAFVPALVKIIFELLDNSLDEGLRTNFEYSNKIDISIDGEVITIKDNGRGIPADTIIDNEGKEVLRPEAAWTRVNAGTSFNDKRTTIGANGVGSSCSNFMSKTFIGKTWNSGEMVTVKCSEGALNIDTKKTSTAKEGSGTEVSFTPDYTLFECNSIHEYDTISIIQDRLLSLMIAFPEVKFTFNKKRIHEGVNNFNGYAKLFGPENGGHYVYTSDNLLFFVCGSEDGFRQNCYINGVNTRLGGSYVDYITNNVADELSTMIKRKYKVDVIKSTIKNGLTFVMFARNFVDAKYDSQTKERLTNSMPQVRDHFQKSFKHDFKFIAKKIMEMEDVIGPIVEAQLNKKLADEARQVAIQNKKLKKAKVANHIAASDPQNGILILCEGNSAASSLINTRNPKTTGCLPLRGKVLSTWKESAGYALKNKELSEIAAVLGVDFTNPESYKERVYKDIGIMADADVDGGHIISLLLSVFYQYFPKLIDEDKAVKIIRSPIVIATKGKQTKWFYNLEDADELKKEKGWDFRYIKGLGSLTDEEYSKVINDPVYDVVSVSNPKYFDVMFLDSTIEQRKAYLMGDDNIMETM